MDARFSDLLIAAQNGDENALNTIITENEGLIHHCMRNLIQYPNGYDADDLLQECRIALIRATLGFDPSRGTRFSTYACSAIKNQINYLFRRSQGIDRAHVHASALDDPVFDDDDGKTRYDFIPDTSTNEYLESVDVDVWIEQNLDAEERQLVRLMMRGYRMKDIADMLGISIHDVRRIQRRLRNRRDQLRMAWNN